MSRLLGLAVVFALGIGGARALGQQRPSRIFPAPQADKCWQTMCFLDMATQDAVLAALAAHPQVTTVELLNDGRLRGDTVIVFAYRRLPPALLTWTRNRYTLGAARADSALLALGDLITAYGGPDRMVLAQNRVVLEFDARQFRAEVSPRHHGADWFYLAARDTVISLQAQTVPLGEEQLRLTVWRWRGLGLYATH